MAQVWGMINGLQLLVHLPLINILFPNNSMAVVGGIISVATFDIPNVDADVLTRYIFGPILEPPFDDAVLIDYPEGTENFIAQMEELGFDSSYLTVGLGTMFLLIFVTAVGLILSTLLIPFTYFIHRL